MALLRFWQCGYEPREWYIYPDMSDTAVGRIVRSGTWTRYWAVRLGRAMEWTAGELREIVEFLDGLEKEGVDEAGDLVRGHGMVAGGKKEAKDAEEDQSV